MLNKKNFNELQSNVRQIGWVIKHALSKLDRRNYMENVRATSGNPPPNLIYVLYNYFKNIFLK